MVEDSTPVIIGVGQMTERVDASDYQGLSAAELAASAARRACMDAFGNDEILQRVDALGAVRTFEDSTPMPAPFGKPDKFPRAIARRLGIDPKVAILTKAGGTTPLALIAELGDRIHEGELEYALAVGAEAISTVRHLTRLGQTRNWHDVSAGSVEDQGSGIAAMQSRYAAAHRVTGAPASYALLENARRARLGLSREAYAATMGELFAPFTTVAANNPYAAAPITPMSGVELITVGARNRTIAAPYPLKLVSRDQVNQAAAVLLTSLGAARALGIPDDRCIFLHGCAIAADRQVIERSDPGASVAARETLATVLRMTEKTPEQIDFFDFYSCFPIPVFAAAVDVLGLAPDDPRRLTVTGGLPYFGGAGNNYVMHAIASMCERLRARPGSFGLLGANGGILSKYGAALFSTAPASWPAREDAEIQARVDASDIATVAYRADGWARVETYTIVYSNGEPNYSIVIGRLDKGGARFYANEADSTTLAAMLDNDPLGRKIFVRSTGPGNRFAFDRETMDRALPRHVPAFQDAYEHVLVERRDHVLEVTINRPQARNSLTPGAHEELSGIFDAFEAEPGLWVAIITGAGEAAFCAGNDLKYAASGKPMWVPETGFGGLTGRRVRTKPIIAAVNGFALGGGMEICLACDLVVADDEAKFALPEVKVGLLAGMGGVVRLPRQIPRKLAVELLLTGRTIGAAEAQGLGLINRIAGAGGAMSAARALADEITSVSPTSVRLTLQAIKESDAFQSTDDAAAAAAHSRVLDELMYSDDAREGVKAFAEKRAPVWRNH